MRIRIGLGEARPEQPLQRRHRVRMGGDVREETGRGEGRGEVRGDGPTRSRYGPVEVVVGERGVEAAIRLFKKLVRTCSSLKQCRRK